MEQWLHSAGNILGKKEAHGFMIKLSSEYEASSSANPSGAIKNYYTKKFFGRGTNLFFKKPVIEARWDSSIKDDRGNFFFSSSLAPTGDNLNTIFLYNYVRGKLRNIPDIGTGAIAVSLFSGSEGDSGPDEHALMLSRDDNNVKKENLFVATGSHVSTGIYKCIFAFTGAVGLETVYDVWFKPDISIINATASGDQYHTGSIKTNSFEASNFNPNRNYVVSMPYLKNVYSNKETERFRLYVREKNWSPNIYTVANSTPETLLIESASYQVTRVVDQKVVIPHGTGSGYNNSTMLSYDVSGNYFDLDMTMLEGGYTYGFQYSFYEDSVSSYRQQPYLFKFKVEKDEY